MSKQKQNLATDCAPKYAVTGYSFNSQDLVLNSNYFWKPYYFHLDPRHFFHQAGGGAFLFPTAAYQSAFFVNQGESSLDHQCKYSQAFVRTSPNQIVRQDKLAKSTPSPLSNSRNATVFQQQRLLPVCEETPASGVPVVVPTPLTNSSQKSAQRGRPKGSKNKPKPLPVDFLEPVPGEDGVSTHSQRAWLLGKQLGLKPRGSEALMLRGLEAQIRQNHPHLR